MNKTLFKIAGLILIVMGAGIMIWGFQLSDSVESKLTEALTGAHSDKVMMHYIGGAISAVVGLFLFFKK